MLLNVCTGTLVFGLSFKGNENLLLCISENALARYLRHRRRDVKPGKQPCSFDIGSINGFDQ